jgi:hypothetical protein
MTCGACHSPPFRIFGRPVAVPTQRQHRAWLEWVRDNHDERPPACAPACHPSHVPPAGLASLEATLETIANRPNIFDDSAQFREFSPDSDSFDPSTNAPGRCVVKALSRSALQMLWHERLGHIHFRRLSEMHRFVKGMPQFKIPTEIEDCPICLASKLRKAPS